MSKQYLSTQQILNNIYDNQSQTINVSGNEKKSKQYLSAQYILNKIYDAENNSIKLSGISASNSTASDTWVTQNKEDLVYLVSNINQIKQVLANSNSSFADVNLSILEKEIAFDSSNAELVDNPDTDSNSNTVYCFKVNGYVLFIGTYESNEAPYPDKYLTKMIYHKEQGDYGKTYIYFEQEQFNFFAKLNPPKNVLKLYVLDSNTNVNDYETITDTNVVIILKDTKHFDVTSNFSSLSFEVNGNFASSHKTCEVIFTKSAGTVTLPTGFKYIGSKNFELNHSYLLTIKDNIVRIDELKD